VVWQVFFERYTRVLLEASPEFPIHFLKIYSKVTGQWYYLYGAVAKPGQTLACLLTEHRDEAAARRLRQKALRRPGVPEKSPLDGRAAHAAAIKSDNAEHGTASIIR
jgi:putative transposase